MKILEVINKLESAYTRHGNIEVMGAAEGLIRKIEQKNIVEEWGQDGNAMVVIDLDE